MIITTCPECGHQFEVETQATLAICARCNTAYQIWQDQDDDPDPDPDYGGAFDGFNVSSDADPGL